MNGFAQRLAQLRKRRRWTQEQLARQLPISFQAVSKWENGQSLPDITQLPKLAALLGVSIDTLLGYMPQDTAATQYKTFYAGSDYYWGLEPSPLCYEILRLKPPVRSWSVLDIGCGEGKDAVFLARNGYTVTAFDIAQTGLDKGRKLAQRHQVSCRFLQADINTFQPDEHYDIIFSSGVLQYLALELRRSCLHDYKTHTKPHGIHVLNVFVQKPFIPAAPDEETPRTLWHSGELAYLYHDWRFHQMTEDIFDCTSGHIPHQHCMDTIIAEKI